MKKSFWSRILVMLGSVLMVVLPILFIDSKPIEVEAASTAYNDLAATGSVADFYAYASANGDSLIKEMTDDEIKLAVNHAYTMLYANQDEPSDDDKQFYIDSVKILKAEYQNGDYLNTTDHAPKAEDEVVTYEVGGSSQYKGISDEGLRITKGTVNLNITSASFTIHGPITLAGGNLNIYLAPSVTSNTHIKREIETVLRVETTGGDINSGYIPYDASRDFSLALDADNSVSFSVSQYSGALFTINGGNFNLYGASDSKRITISGAGQFYLGTDVLKDNDDQNDNDGNVMSYPVYGQVDDVESKAPIFDINDTVGDVNVSVNYANIQHNNNAADVNTVAGSVVGGAFRVYGRSPVLSVSNSEITRCRSVNYGGFMFMNSSVGGKVTLTDVRVTECYTDAPTGTEGGTLRTLGGSYCNLEMTRVNFGGNYSRYSASAFLWSALNADTLLVTDCTVYNNIAYYSSTIMCMGRMRLEGETSITDNRSIKGNGGAIQFTNWSSVTLSSSFKLLEDSDLVLGEGVTISGNSAGGNGGAIYFDSSIIVNNMQGEGGLQPIYYPYKDDGSPYSSCLTINGATINNNTAVGQGGAIYIRKNTNADTYIVQAEINGGTISDNNAGGNGGAFYLSGKEVDFTMNGGIISNNSTLKSGGSLYLGPTASGSGSAYINGGEITGNTASEQGGAMYVNSGNVTISNGTITKNQSVQAGGAVSITGASAVLTVEGGTVSENISQTNSGGAIYAYSGVTIIVNGGNVSNNQALGTNGNGGAIFANGIVTIQDGTISSNYAKYRGGAIYVNAGSVTISNGTINGNQSVSGGGAISITGASAVMTIEGGTVSENISTGLDGGAIHADGGATVTINGGTISNNQALGPGNNDGNGGAICAYGNVTINNGIISDNYASRQGGGILISGSAYTMTVEGGIISGNTAGRLNGGGVYVFQSTFNMKGGTISGNNANGTAMEGHGGGVYVNKGAFAIDGASIISDNTANVGGGVYVQGNGSVGSFTMTGGTIKNNKATQGSGGAVFVEKGSFTMTSGTLTENAAPKGWGGAVYTEGTVTIGAENCNGDLGVDDHPSCPVISNNSAVNGGAFAVNGGSPTIHCGSITDNAASAEGGAVYVTNGNVVVNYVVMEHNTAVSGGGFCIEALTQNLNVTVSSGFIRYNQATEGGGLKVYASGTYVATVVVGKEGCDGAVDSAHKHPDISSNIAEGEGGGLHLVSDSANGILFTMWCGRLHQNIANENIPTGNMIQEGGQVSIHGTYTIDNVTVNNGSYLRPSFGTKTVTLGFDYRFPDGYTSDANELKSITLTIGEGDSRDMYINLPAYHNVALNDTTMILLRWSESPDNNNVTYETSSKFVVNETNFTAGESITLYGVWIAQGAGIAEVPYVTNGQQFDAWQDGSSVAIDISADGFFTALFEVSECDPSQFGERYLTFARPLNAGTAIILVDLTALSGYKNYYCYVVNGEETTVSLSDFTKMGSPLVHWSNSRADANGESEEDLMFMFDMGLSDAAFMGGFWISLTREYVDTTKAHISQTVSCAINEVQMPEITAPAESEVGDSVTVNYEPGIAEDESSVYYGKDAAIVISGKETTLPPEAYILIGETRYNVNTSGAIVIPLGDANTAASLNMQLVSSALTNSELGIDLNVDLYMCVDATRPMNDKLIYSTEISMRAIPLPAVSISMAERIFYLENLPASVAINVVQENIGDKYRLDWAVLKQSFGGAEYGDVNGEAAVTDGVLTFGQNISEGNFRIVVTVVDKETDAEALTVVYNFIVLDSQ